MIVFLRAVSLGTNRADGAAASSHTQAGSNGSSITAQNGDAAPENKPAGEGQAATEAANGSKVASNGKGHKNGKKALSLYLQERRLYSSPSLFDVAAFFFANGSLLGGPFFEFKEWDEFLNRRGQFYEVSSPTSVLTHTAAAVAEPC